MTETDEYDRIFAALKHPARRQILLLLEEKGEALFSEIQKAVGVNDTGLLSCHLKKLGIRNDVGLSENCCTKNWKRVGYNKPIDSK